MPGMNTAEVMVGNGQTIAAAPPGTAAPASLATALASPWVDLGYADEDGVTLSDSPSETNINAWQTIDPILVLTTEIARTFAFNLMQWNAATLAFVFGGGLVTPAGTDPAFEPGLRAKYALLMRWTNASGVLCGFYVPRGQVTGDVSSQLVRTAAGTLALTFTSTPDRGLSEKAWRYSQVGLTTDLILNDDGTLEREENGARGGAKVGAAK